MKCADCNFYRPAGARSYMRGGWCGIELPFYFIRGNDSRRRVEYPESRGCDLGREKVPPATCNDCARAAECPVPGEVEAHFAVECPSFVKES